MEDLFGRALGPGIRMAKFLDPDLPPVRADANQLELALLNLVVNARDAMPLSGSLTLLASASSVDAERGPKNLVRGDYVKLSLIDTGMGMDAETLAKATEPFFTTKGLGKGTGLGLSMVHGLVIQSGGTMTITSKPGEGTTVELWLPRSETSPMSHRSEQAAPVAANRFHDDVRRILVVDDDPLVGTGTAEMLADLGHSVVEARSGAEAITILEQDRSIELLLTDHSMPGMTGLELATIVRASFPRLPILLASGYAELPNGGDWNIQLPRLAKPYRQDELAVAIAACFTAGPSNVVSLRAQR